ncbi:hypothetical protein [Nitrososphaera viennensis]|mgnify:FL=1|uniref:Uncharacterized protein n=2 Tax=Nitrososphaera viennensis TaxID=1034015 RepID=A0A060HGL1_9ARCH|nr:hypothetical protein [Nitrososphaera viennensis]AIC15749.1 hypothetical protein NVIE_015050 [Nitrososphaera viennensis EN76]UVS67749.1 hypothetical protein NWT39_07475 [Nitrososphaera viennensis]
MNCGVKTLSGDVAVTIMIASEADDENFMKIVDDLVVSAEGDPELAEGLKWIDMQSRKNGVTFYEMALLILKKHMAERRAKEWMRAKSAAAIN